MVQYFWLANISSRGLNDPVWSVIILLGCGLVFTAYCIVYIMRLAFKEMKDGSNDTPKSEELLQLQSDGDCESPGRGHD